MVDQRNTDLPAVDEPSSDLLGKRASDFVIGYVSCPQDSGRNYLGGILLTDWRTRPIEFSFVSPVKVTMMQRIIHGKTLDEAITVELIARRLLTDSTKPPDVIFVDSDILLGLQRSAKTPVARLTRDEGVSAQAGSLSTIRFATARGMENESTVGNVLSALEPFVDLIEPFSRVTEAIKEAMKSVAANPAKA